MVFLLFYFLFDKNNSILVFTLSDVLKLTDSLVADCGFCEHLEKFRYRSVGTSPHEESTQLYDGYRSKWYCFWLLSGFPSDNTTVSVLVSKWYRFWFRIGIVSSYSLVSLLITQSYRFLQLFGIDSIYSVVSLLKTQLYSFWLLNGIDSGFPVVSLLITQWYRFWPLSGIDSDYSILSLLTTPSYDFYHTMVSLLTTAAVICLPECRL